MSDPVQEFNDAVANGEHLFQDLEFVNLDGPEDHLTIDLTVIGRIRNNRGALQGGLVATIIDMAAGQLAWRAAPAGCQVATADLTVHYLAPVLVGPARATSTIVRSGKRLIVVSTEVIDVDNGRRCAISTASFAVLEPR